MKEARKITVTEGLSELKLLDARIVKAIGKPWAMVNIIRDKNAPKEFAKKVKAQYQSVTDLMEQRDRIKSAIVVSNATTRIKVGDMEMTVAEAIEKKSSIEYEKRLLGSFKDSFTSGQNLVNERNAIAQRNVDALLEKLASTTREDLSAAQKTLSENYMEQNGYELVDPLVLEKKIAELDERIDTFEKNVDIALSLSNATTFIEV